ncbi:cation:proton antiporter [Methylibium sp.]|uniref:cation:proton antiporter n=1 Tax=Methylibium sp. TaxID=2067992 RepID=UPI003D0C2F90
MPFAPGLLFAALVPQALVGASSPLNFALFVATAFSITAMPVLGRIMMEFELTRRPVGVIAISAAAVSDVCGWMLLAVVTALSTSGLVPWNFALRALGVLLFGALCWWGVRPLLTRFARAQLAHAGAEQLPATLMGGVIAAIFVAGMTTYQLGIFAVFGGFMVGVLLHQEQRFVRAWNDKVGSFVNVFFLPIFFTYTGLRTDVGSLGSASDWGWCVLLIVLATLGKFGACWLAARRAGLAPAEARIVGVLMNTRGLMELIIVNVGYDLGVIGREMFTMLVLMAIFSTVITTPLLRRWLPQASVLRQGLASASER